MLNSIFIILKTMFHKNLHRQICQGNNQDYRVEDTHHFLFAGALRGHDTYSWSNVNGQVRFPFTLMILFLLQITSAKII